MLKSAGTPYDRSARKSLNMERTLVSSDPQRVISSGKRKNLQESSNTKKESTSHLARGVPTLHRRAYPPCPPPRISSYREPYPPLSLHESGSTSRIKSTHRHLVVVPDGDQSVRSSDGDQAIFYSSTSQNFPLSCTYCIFAFPLACMSSEGLLPMIFPTKACISWLVK